MCGFPNYLPPDDPYWEWEKQQDDKPDEGAQW